MTAVVWRTEYSLLISRDLVSILQAEAVESIRSKSTAEAQKLLTDFKKIYSELPYRENEDYRFIPTTSLSKVVKASYFLWQ